MPLHVCPQTDIRPHVLDGTDCPCDPDVEYLNPETGVPYSGNGPTITHHCFEMDDEKKIGWVLIEE